MFASTNRIVERRKEVDEVLQHIAEMLKEAEVTTEDWLNSCFVSDESSLGDFFCFDRELVELGERPGLQDLKGRHLVFEVADAVRRRTANPPRIM